MHMTEFDASDGQAAAMDIKTSGLKHSVTSDIKSLQRLLREGYASGFAIFKELLQNADDARAQSLLLAAHEGFPRAVNPLLRAPGLIVANDGPVLARHMEGITSASGGSKADERAAVGRFGLGQKSVYHLCDAFFALGWVVDDEGKPLILLMNPWNGMAAAHHACTDWKNLDRADAQILLDQTRGLGMQAGLALFLPLRSAELMPGPGLCLSQDTWQPDEAIDKLLTGEEIAATLCCLRHIETILIRRSDGSERRITVGKGAQRLSGPSTTDGIARIAGTIDGALPGLAFSGQQRWAREGQAVALLHQPGWQLDYDIDHKPIPPKADPHGAVIVCRKQAAGTQARLLVRNAVYLPLGAPLVDATLATGSQDIELVLHGYFFVSSDRTRLRDDDHIESRWNEALRREATLPLVLDALADALPALPGDPERRAVLQALGDTDWWMLNRTQACGGRALALVWQGTGQAQWRIVPAASLRPVPVSPAASLRRLQEAIPGLAPWCEARQVSLAFGTTLSEARPCWPDAELADLVRRIGSAAFTKGAIAEALGLLLGEAPGPETRAALAEQLRLAAGDIEQSFAPADRLKAIACHLPPDQRLVLPNSVDNRQVIKALAGPSLPVKPGWLPADQQVPRRLDLDETVDLLAAMEPLLSQAGEAGNQAATMVSHILAHGAGLEDLARHPKGKTLRVIPATHIQSGRAERLSLEDTLVLRNRGLLFAAAPDPWELGLLAAAIAEPAIHQLLLRDGGLANCASAKRPESLAAVLRQAKTYGDPGKCGELAEHLRDHAGRDELRRLVAQDNALDGEAELVELADLGDALDKLADDLCRKRGVRLVAARVVEELHKVRQKIGLKTLDVAQLGRWLGDAVDDGTLPDFDDAAAQALLGSAIDDAILKRLPLNRCAGEARLFAAHEVYRGHRSEVPPSLSGLARLVEPWPDPKASQKQNRLIDRWGHEAVIRTALAAENPARFTAEIAAALEGLPSLSEDLASALRDAAWIGAGGRAWRAGQVLDLPPRAAQAWHALVGENGDFLLADKLPPCLRADAVQQRLSAILPDHKQSFENALLAVAEREITGLCIDVAAHVADLRRIARAGGDLGAGAWPLLAAAMDTDLDDETLIAFANLLPEPDLATTKAQMNALAGLAETSGLGEVVSRLHRATFGRKAADLCRATGFLPQDLLVPNEDGRFHRADTLALDVDGLAREAMLDRGYGEKIASIDTPPVKGLPVGETSRLPLTTAVERAFARLIEHDIGDGILLVLAMLGRGEDIRVLADRWQGQISFDRICHELDQVAAELGLGASAIVQRLAELRFEASFHEGGKVEVPSAAGILFEAPLSGQGEALLISCHQRQRTQEEIAQGLAVWTLVLGEVAPQSVDEAKDLLRQFVPRLAPALLLAMPQQRLALQQKLDSYFASNQRSREEAEQELREVLHDRLAGIKSGHVIKAALKAFHRDKYPDPHKARDALWSVAASPDGSAELLAATRKKIQEMGYQASRALFELYQNAVDAQAQWQGQGKVRVEARRDAEGTITRLRLIHWGRPINQPGPDPRRAEDEGHGRDLANILAISHSAKEGNAVTGRFGLGFKTVHMLADDVGIASGGVILRIAGGMIPVPWPEGEAEARPFNERGRKATLIDIPVAPGREDEANSAWDAFRQAAPLLAALGRNGSIELVDGEQESHFLHHEQPLFDGLALVALDEGRRALRFDLDEGFRLFLPLGRNGLHAFRDNTAQFWNLVPLVGLSRQGAWLMEGPFAVDPGRTHFSGSPEDSARLFARLGRRLADRLIALHDAATRDKAGLAQRLGLAEDGLPSLLAGMVGRFAQDLETREPQRHLHKGEGGLARLLQERPLVSLAFGGAARAGEIKWRLDGALAQPDVQGLLSAWPALDPFRQGMIDAETATLLEQLDLPRGVALDLPGLVERSIGKKGMDTDCAEMLSLVLNDALRKAASKEEDEALRSILRERPWLADDGSWQPIRLLAFPQSRDDDEQARAAFAPPAGRLAASYGKEGVRLAMFAREQAGHNETVWQGWAERAEAAPDRKLAVLRFLVDADQRTVNLFRRAAAWLQGIATDPLLDGLSHDERMLLLAKLGIFPPQPELETKSAPFRNEARTVLLEIAEWWRNEGPALRPAYDRAVYPQDGFRFADLREDNDEAWFTLLALATFQTLGRIRPFQSRQFVENAMNEGWWRNLPAIDPQGSNLDPFVERLRAWSEPDAREDYMIWRRCLTDLCRIARHLDDYRRLFALLPDVIRQEGDIGLRNYLNPASSGAAGRMGIFAAPLARCLGIGANWVVRELARNGFYSAAQSSAVLPYGWSTAERVRKLAYRLGMGCFDHGIDEGRLLHDAVHRLIGDEASFGGDGDLPLHIITLAKHRDTLNAILYSSDDGGWLDDGLDETGDDDA